MRQTGAAGSRAIDRLRSSRRRLICRDRSAPVRSPSRVRQGSRYDLVLAKRRCTSPQSFTTANARANRWTVFLHQSGVLRWVARRCSQPRRRNTDSTCVGHDSLISYFVDRLTLTSIPDLKSKRPIRRANIHRLSDGCLTSTLPSDDQEFQYRMVERDSRQPTVHCGLAAVVGTNLSSTEASYGYA